MKVKTLAIFLAIAMATASCQKESLMQFNENGTPAVTVNTVYYTMNGQEGSLNLPNDEAWDSFLDRMLALAREGNVVTFSQGHKPGSSLSKEKVTYTTTSEDDAKRWAKEMSDQGYDVTISYDKTTGIYTCTAIK